MAKTIAILNFKGGVGKTTTAINLGAALHLLKKKVLLVDLDFQCNTTYTLNFEVGDGETIFDALTAKEPAELPIYEFKDGFDFVPASIQLENVGEQLVNRLRKEEILKRIIQPYAELYDYVLLDCPPNGGILNINAMSASDSILVPIDCEVYSLQGMKMITDKFHEVKEFINPELEIEGYLLTRFDGRLGLHKMAAAQMQQKYPGQVFNARIRRNTDLSKTPAEHMTIFDYNPTAIGAEDYMQLAREITGIKRRSTAKK